MKRNIFVIIVIVGGLIVFPYILKSAATAYNNKKLSQMENLILHEFELHDIHLRNHESKISHETYGMFDHRQSWLESCIYTTIVELDKDIDLNSDKISTLISDFDNELNETY